MQSSNGIAEIKFQNDDVRSHIKPYYAKIFSHKQSESQNDH